MSRNMNNKKRTISLFVQAFVRFFFKKFFNLVRSVSGSSIKTGNASSKTTFYLINFFSLNTKLNYQKVIFIFFCLLSGFYVESASYSKHWFGAKPYIKNKNLSQHQSQKNTKNFKQNDQNILLIYDLFIILFDTDKKFTRWIAYHLSPDLIWGKLKVRRNYQSDPYLSANKSLSKKHYIGASKFGYDRGHLAPLGSFKNSTFSYQAQYLSNIVPQSRDLNQGPWHALEIAIREFVKKGHELKILAGPVYGDSNYGKNYKTKQSRLWPSINGHVEQLPTGFWKIVAFKKGNQVKICSFLMPQEIKSRQTPIKKYKIKTSNLQTYTGLIIFEGVKHKNDCSFLF